MIQYLVFGTRSCSWPACVDISLLRMGEGGQWAVTTHTFLVTCCCATKIQLSRSEEDSLQAFENHRIRFRLGPCGDPFPL